MSPSFAVRAPARRSVAVFALPTLLTLVGAFWSPPPAGAVRMMSYNLLNWGGSSGASRVQYMQSVTRGIAPDLVVSQELTDQAGVDLFLNQVLNFREPGQWAAAPFDNGPDTDNGLWYRTSKWTYLDKKEVHTALRDATRWHLRLAGYDAAEAEVYAYSFHLKASSGSSNEALRLAEMKIIRRDAESLPVGSHVLFCGDYNVYTYLESPFQWALSDTGLNIGRMKDPINQLGVWHDNSSYAPYHTQSPRTLAFGGGATGGMDDRFDFVLESYNLDDGLGMDLDESTYKAYGNDGFHCCNSAINGAPTNGAIGQEAADSLMYASDHIPVQVDFIVPAKLGLSPNAIAFGTVITGATAAQTLTVSNPADVPGDGLDYSFTAPAGFAAPGGGFVTPAGGSTPHSITMDASTPGVKSAQLGLSTDAPDAVSATIDLAGTVLAHATPSLDSLAVAVLDTIDFGTQAAGGFSDQPAFVWNQAYDALRAKLHLTAASITGDAASRFSLVEPFAPALLGSESARYDVHFDDSGVAADSTFEARLTFAGEDDPSLSGAIARPAVSYVLLARFSASTVAVDPIGPPTATLLYAPSPNPVTSGRLAVRFDLAQPGRASIELYDVRGRRVSVVTDGERPAGRHSVAWSGRDTHDHPVPNGVYFARLVTAQGMQNRRFVILR